MKNKTLHKIAFLLSIFFASYSFVIAQDFENLLDKSAPVVVDDEVPQPAPIVIDESVPLIDKDTIRLRLARIEKQIPLSYSSAIISFIHYFTVRNREYSRMILRRKDIYFPIFEKILMENNMPDELKYLSIVESGLNPRARSRAGAVGLWQFVPNTGKYYKLNSDWYIDDRCDPVKSTQAACEYLRYLYKMFGNWELALAAYNCGPGNVRKAIKASRHKRDFWEIYYNLPRETRSYVPQFIAISYLMNFSKEHNLYADYFETLGNNHTIYTDQYINLDVLAKHLDVCPEDLQRINPTLLRNRIPAYAKNFPLKLPSEKMHVLMSNYCAIMDSCSQRGEEELKEDINPNSERSINRNTIVHVVQKGEILSKIALKYHVSMAEIKTWNNLKSNALKYKQKLTVWRGDRQRNDDKKIAVKSASDVGFIGPKQIYLVQPGDTIWGISQKKEISVEKLKKINNLKGNELKAGQKLVIG